jgi:hypothetical protein
MRWGRERVQRHKFCHGLGLSEYISRPIHG